MNYEYIEQLLQRYWQCQTTLEEEQILRSFFSQDDIPGSLQQYVPLFSYQQEAQNSGMGEELGAEFDARILGMIEEDVRPKSRFVNFRKAAMPFVKAAAAVAVVLTIGNVVERANEGQNPGVVTPTDTYILKDEISAKIKVIDREKAEKLAQASDTVNVSVDEQQE